MNFSYKNRCAKCNRELSLKVADYSLKNFNILLCFDDQSVLKKPFRKATPTARKLFVKLIEARIPARLEQYDGYKSIDIAIPKAKINIEVDGKHHHYNHTQALTDLYRHLYSSKKGFETIRLPNILVDAELNKVSQSLIEFIRERLKKTNRYSNNQWFYFDDEDQWDDEDDDYYY